MSHIFACQSCNLLSAANPCQHCGIEIPQTVTLADLAAAIAPMAIRRTDAIANLPTMWQCRCGKLAFNHYTHCGSCGAERPAPPPEEPPSDAVRAEPPLP